VVQGWKEKSQDRFQLERDLDRRLELKHLLRSILLGDNLNHGSLDWQGWLLLHLQWERRTIRRERRLKLVVWRLSCRPWVLGQTRKL
jgi:hypothetical protein